MLLALATFAAQAQAQAPAPAPKERPRIGLVLSGGGARGFAHIGVLKVLHEMNVQIDLIAATSMGAIVGGAYAAGHTPEQLERLVVSVDWGSIFSLLPPRQDLHWRRKEDDLKGLSNFEFGVRADGVTLPRGAAGSQNLEQLLRLIAGPVQDINDLARLPVPFAATATNLETGKLEVLDRVPLAEAMRASMSIPGAFAPVDYQGKLLVDGGLVRNLPVDVARNMGADIVIAVNIGTPLAPRATLNTALGVAQQMFNILTEQNVQASLAQLRDADILIEPDLTGLTFADFTDGAALIAAGEQAARSATNKLAALALPPAAYAAREAGRSARVAEEQHLRIAAVRTEGLRFISAATVERELALPLNRDITLPQLLAAVRATNALGHFERVDYRLEGEDDQARTLVLLPVEKDWGPHTLRFGGRLATNFSDESSFRALVAHTRYGIGENDAEWRNELQIGDERRLATEYYFPLAPGSGWFLLPRAGLTRTASDVFVGDLRTSRFENSIFGADLQVGYSFPRLGAVRAGLGRTRADRRPLITPEPVDRVSVTESTLTLDVRFDRLDNVSFPARGWALDASYFRFLESAATATRRDQLQIDLFTASTFGRYTIDTGLRYGQSVLAGGFRLGGLFELSGTPVGRYTGSRVVLGRALVYRNVSDAFGDIAMPIYAGASLEAGNTFEQGEDYSWTRLHKAASLFLGAQTVFGPLYFAWGVTQGGNAAVYLYWGLPWSAGVR
jgi:NTE family protein